MGKSHLINTKEILMMDQMEKLRDKETKLKKIKDDELNRSNEFQKHNSKRVER